MKVFLVVSVYLLALKCSLGSTLIDHFVVTKQNVKPEYDFIIVGAGSAGCRLAEKLTSRNDFEVLLLEAGGVAPDYTEIPLLATLTEKSDIDWNYEIAPQKHAFQAFINQSKTHISGKVLGGSSVVNFMVYQRGNRYDYDNWVKEFGAEGWGFDDVLPIFMADEGNTDLNLSSDIHGRDGPLKVSSPAIRTPFQEAFFKSTVEQGYKFRDVLDGDSRGVYYTQATIGNGIRYSSAKAFIEPILGRRDNLHISLNSTVTRILIENNRAAGVVFEKDGSTHVVKSSKEVILSAGTIRSPQLLMLSGIGPKERLAEFNIPVISDLPVGDNMEDHLMHVGLIAHGPKHSVADMGNITELFNHFLHKNGSFTSPSGAHIGVMYLDTKFASPEVPDIELIFLAAENTFFKFPLPTEVLNEFIATEDNESVYLINPILNHPKSRGTIRLRSNNIHDKPIIDPNYLADELDVNRLVEGSKIAVKILETSHFKEIGIEIKNVFPPCKHHPFLSDEYFRCVVSMATHNVWHFCGTCRMGSIDRNDVVVDPRLRVKGIKGLRVADASIMPKITTGHLNAVAIMIGAKAGEMILEDHA